MLPTRGFIGCLIGIACLLLHPIEGAHDPGYVQDVFVQFETICVLSDPYSNSVTAVSVSRLYLERESHSFHIADNETWDDYCLCSTVKRPVDLPELFLGVRVFYNMEDDAHEHHSVAPPEMSEPARIPPHVDQHLPPLAVNKPQSSPEAVPQQEQGHDEDQMVHYLHSNNTLVGMIAVYVLVAIAVTVHHCVTKRSAPRVLYAPIASPEIVVCPNTTPVPSSGPRIVYQDYQL